MAYSTYNTSIGKISIVSNGRAITEVSLSASDLPHTPDALTDCAAQQINEYLNGKRRAFSVPLEPHGTPFQLAVWHALKQIPYGQTCSYKQIAEAVENPKACRAVGLANNKNPIMIIIPCHRVIGSDGSLTGYGGGINIKKKLLDIENKYKVNSP